MNKECVGYNRGIKLTALIVAFVFTATSVTWSTPANASSSEVVAPVFSPIEKFSVPSEMGSIQKMSLGTRGAGLDATKGFNEPLATNPESQDGRAVILIQDAHAVIDAQENIEKILGYLGKEYGIRLAAIEGAKGRLEPVLLRTFPNLSVRKRVLAGYENRAELSGSEMAAVSGEVASEYEGMEDWPLYEKNYFAYLSAQEKKDSLLAKWKAYKQGLDSERAKAYDAKLNEFEDTRENFLAERSSLLDLLVYLSNFKDLLKTSSGYEELPGLISSIGYEKSGRQEALVPLVRQIADEFKTKYLRGLGVKAEMNFYNRYQAFMTGQITAGQMLQYLVQLGNDSGKTVRLTPSLKNLLGHTEVLSEIKGSRLFDELQRFLPEVEASLAQTAVQKEIAVKYQRLFFLKGLIELELTHEDLAKYQKEPDAYLSLIADSQFSKDLIPALDFYQAALERDHAFMDKIDAMMKDNGQKTVAVVAGGFHTNGIERILRDKGVAYAVVMPKIASLAGNENYSKVMKGDVSFKEYLKTTYFDGLMRHAAKALTDALPLTERVSSLKLWRDNLIRDLARQGRIAEAGKYLPYIDEQLKTNGEVAFAGPQRTRDEILTIVKKELEKFKKDSFAKIWKTFEFQLGIFTDGLKQLASKKDLNAQTVSDLLSRASNAKPGMLAPAAGMGLFPEIGILKQIVRNVPDLSEITDKLATSQQILEAVEPYAMPKANTPENELISNTAADLVKHGFNSADILKATPEVGQVSTEALAEPVKNMLDELAALTPNQTRAAVAARLAAEMTSMITSNHATTTLTLARPDVVVKRSESRKQPLPDVALSVDSSQAAVPMSTGGGRVAISIAEIINSNVDMSKLKDSQYEALQNFIESLRNGDQIFKAYEKFLDACQKGEHFDISGVMSEIVFDAIRSPKNMERFSEAQLIQLLDSFSRSNLSRDDSNALLNVLLMREMSSRSGMADLLGKWASHRLAQTRGAEARAPLVQSVPNSDAVSRSQIGRILYDEERARVLFEVLSVCRGLIEFDLAKRGGRDGTRIRLGDNLFALLDTGSFRRHVLYEEDSSGKITVSCEIKIPGERAAKVEVDAEDYLVSREFEKISRLDGKFRKALMCITYDNGQYALYGHNVRFTSDSPFRVIVYEYDMSVHEKQMRLNDLVKSLQLSSLEQEDIAKQIAELMRLIAVNAWNGQMDMVHLQNFVATQIDSDGQRRFEISLASDFGDFVTVEDTADMQKRIRGMARVFLANVKNADERTIQQIFNEAADSLASMDSGFFGRTVSEFIRGLDKDRLESHPQEVFAKALEGATYKGEPIKVTRYLGAGADSLVLGVDINGTEHALKITLNDLNWIEQRRAFDAPLIDHKTIAVVDPKDPGVSWDVSYFIQPIATMDVPVMDALKKVPSGYDLVDDNSTFNATPTKMFSVQFGRITEDGKERIVLLDPYAVQEKGAEIRSPAVGMTPGRKDVAVAEARKILETPAKYSLAIKAFALENRTMSSLKMQSLIEKGEVGFLDNSFVRIKSLTSEASHPAGPARPETSVASREKVSAENVSSLLKSGELTLEEIVKQMQAVHASVFPGVPFRDLERRKHVENGNVTVVRQNGKIVGYIIHTKMNINNTGYVSGLAVQTGFQGRGIGTELMNTAGHWFQQHGVRSVSVVPSKGAGSFYNEYFGVTDFTRQVTRGGVASVLDVEHIVKMSDWPLAVRSESRNAVTIGDVMELMNQQGWKVKAGSAKRLSGNTTLYNVAWQLELEDGKKVVAKMIGGSLDVEAARDLLNDLDLRILSMHPVGLPGFDEEKGVVKQNGKLVAVVMDFVEGPNLVEALKQGLITREEALDRLGNLVRDWADRGLELVDTNPFNFFFSRGELVLVDAGSFKITSAPIDVNAGIQKLEDAVDAVLSPELVRVSQTARTETREKEVLSAERVSEFEFAINELYTWLDVAEIKLTKDNIGLILRLMKTGGELPANNAEAEPLRNWMRGMSQEYADVFKNLEITDEPAYSDLVFTPEGEAVLILGPSMSGKSTLATALQEEGYGLGGESDTHYLMLHLPGHCLLAGAAGRLETIRARGWLDDPDPDHRRVAVQNFQPAIGSIKAIVLLDRREQYGKPRISEAAIQDLSQINSLYEILGPSDSKVDKPVQVLRVTHGYTNRTGFRSLAGDLSKRIAEFSPKMLARSEVRSELQGEEPRSGDSEKQITENTRSIDSLWYSGKRSYESYFNTIANPFLAFALFAASVLLYVFLHELGHWFVHDMLYQIKGGTIDWGFKLKWSFTPYDYGEYTKLGTWFSGIDTGLPQALLSYAGDLIALPVFAVILSATSLYLAVKEKMVASKALELLLAVISMGPAAYAWICAIGVVEGDYDTAYRFLWFWFVHPLAVAPVLSVIPFLWKPFHIYARKLFSKSIVSESTQPKGEFSTTPTAGRSESRGSKKKMARQDKKVFLNQLIEVRNSIVGNEIGDIASVGDQHGKSEVLEKILATAEKALKEGTEFHPVIHGDAFDRGQEEKEPKEKKSGNPRNWEILQELMKIAQESARQSKEGPGLKSPKITVDYVLGNHDVMMILGNLVDGPVGELSRTDWLANGGNKTYSQLGPERCKALSLWLLRNAKFFSKDKLGFGHFHAFPPFDKNGYPLFTGRDMEKFQKELDNIQAELPEMPTGIAEKVPEAALAPAENGIQKKVSVTDTQVIRRGDVIPKKSVLNSELQKKVSEFFLKTYDIYADEHVRYKSFISGLLDEEGRVDETRLEGFLEALGVTGIVYAHYHFLKLAILAGEFRIMGVDTEGDPGHLISNSTGIYYEPSKDRNSLGEKDGDLVALQSMMLNTLDAWISRLEEEINSNFWSKGSLYVRKIFSKFTNAGFFPKKSARASNIVPSSLIIIDAKDVYAVFRTLQQKLLTSKPVVSALSDSEVAFGQYAFKLTREEDSKVPLVTLVDYGSTEKAAMPKSDFRSLGTLRIDETNEADALFLKKLSMILKAGQSLSKNHPNLLGDPAGLAAAFNDLKIATPVSLPNGRSEIRGGFSKLTRQLVLFLMLELTPVASLAAQAAKKLPPHPGDVRGIQQILIQTGEPIKVDGDYGKQTKDAVMQLQKKMRDLKLYDGAVDGLWGDKTAAAAKVYLERVTAKSEGPKEPGAVTPQASTKVSAIVKNGVIAGPAGLGAVVQRAVVSKPLKPGTVDSQNIITTYFYETNRVVEAARKNLSDKDFKKIFRVEKSQMTPERITQVGEFIFNIHLHESMGFSKTEPLRSSKGKTSTAISQAMFLLGTRSDLFKDPLFGKVSGKLDAAMPTDWNEFLVDGPDANFNRILMTILYFSRRLPSQNFSGLFPKDISSQAERWGKDYYTLNDLSAKKAFARGANQFASDVGALADRFLKKYVTSGGIGVGTLIIPELAQNSRGRSEIRGEREPSGISKAEGKVIAGISITSMFLLAASGVECLLAAFAMVFTIAGWRQLRSWFFNEIKSFQEPQLAPLSAEDFGRIRAMETEINEKGYASLGGTQNDRDSRRIAYWLSELTGERLLAVHPGPGVYSPTHDGRMAFDVASTFAKEVDDTSMEFARTGKPMRILVIGAGTGMDALAVWHHAISNGVENVSVTATELQKNAFENIKFNIEIFKKLGENDPSRSITPVLVTDATSLDELPGEYDRIFFNAPDADSSAGIASSRITHMPADDFKKLMAAVTKKLAPGGKALVRNINDPAIFPEGFQPQQAGEAYVLRASSSWYVWEYSKESKRSEIRKAESPWEEGFTIVAREPVPGAKEIRRVGDHQGGLTDIQEVAYEGQLYYAKSIKDPKAKMLDGEPFLPDREEFNYILRQPEILNALNRKGVKGIPKVEHLIVTKDDTHVILFERFPPGDSLEKKIASGKLNPHRVLRAILQVARTLEELHNAGVYHWDVKPGNIWVANDWVGDGRAEDEGKVILFDFDTAFETRDEFFERDLGTIGSPRYMSPVRYEFATMGRELMPFNVLDMEPFALREEAYALAMTLLHMLVDPQNVLAASQTRPDFPSGSHNDPAIYAGELLREMNRRDKKGTLGIPKEIVTVLNIAFENETGYPTVADLRRALERAMPKGSWEETKTSGTPFSFLARIFKSRSEVREETAPTAKPGISIAIQDFLIGSSLQLLGFLKAKGVLRSADEIAVNYTVTGANQSAGKTYSYKYTVDFDPVHLQSIISNDNSTPSTIPMGQTIEVPLDTGVSVIFRDAGEIKLACDFSRLRKAEITLNRNPVSTAYRSSFTPLPYAGGAMAFVNKIPGIKAYQERLRDRERAQKSQELEKRRINSFILAQERAEKSGAFSDPRFVDIREAGNSRFEFGVGQTDLGKTILVKAFDKGTGILDSIFVYPFAEGVLFTIGRRLEIEFPVPGDEGLRDVQFVVKVVPTGTPEATKEGAPKSIYVIDTGTGDLKNKVSASMPGFSLENIARKGMLPEDNLDSFNPRAFGFSPNPEGRSWSKIFPKVRSETRSEPQREKVILWHWPSVVTEEVIALFATHLTESQLKKHESKFRAGLSIWNVEGAEAGVNKYIWSWLIPLQSATAMGYVFYRYWLSLNAPDIMEKYFAAGEIPAGYSFETLRAYLSEHGISIDENSLQENRAAMFFIQKVLASLKPEILEKLRGLPIVLSSKEKSNARDNRLVVSSEEANGSARTFMFAFTHELGHVIYRVMGITEHKNRDNDFRDNYFHAENMGLIPGVQEMQSAIDRLFYVTAADSLEYPNEEFFAEFFSLLTVYPKQMSQFQEHYRAGSVDRQVVDYFLDFFGKEVFETDPRQKPLLNAGENPHSWEIVEMKDESKVGGMKEPLASDQVSHAEQRPEVQKGRSESRLAANPEKRTEKQEMKIPQRINSKVNEPVGVNMPESPKIAIPAVPSYSELSLVDAPLQVLTGATGRKIAGMPLDTNLQAWLTKQGQVGLAREKDDFDSRVVEFEKQFAVATLPQLLMQFFSRFGMTEAMAAEIAVRATMTSTQTRFADIQGAGARGLDAVRIQKTTNAIYDAISKMPGSSISMIVNNGDDSAFVLKALKTAEIQRLVVLYDQKHPAGRGWNDVSSVVLKYKFSERKSANSLVGDVIKGNNGEPLMAFLTANLGVDQHGILSVLADFTSTANPDLKNLVCAAAVLINKIYASASPMDQELMKVNPEMIRSELREKGIDLLALSAKNGVLVMSMELLAKEFAAQQDIEKAA